MSKAIKIEVPDNLDFNLLVKGTIESLLKNINDKSLVPEHRRALEKITVIETKLLAGAIKLAAKDGLYDNEVQEIIGDLYDMIERASKKNSFDKMIKNPSDPRFKLTPEMTQILKELSEEERSQLFKDLNSQSPKMSERFSNIFKDAESILLPIFKVVAAQVISLALCTVAKLLNDKIDGPIGDIIEKSLESMATNLEKRNIVDDNDAKLTGDLDIHNGHNEH